MPRIKPLVPKQKIEYQRKVLTERCERIMRSEDISKTKVASYLEISPQSVAQQFQRKHITMEVFITVCTLANINGDVLGEIVKVGDL